MKKYTISPLKCALIIFVKNPVLGKVKTRLAESIGDEKALKVYLQLLEKTNLETRPLSCSKYLFYSDHIENEDIWDSTVYSKVLQQGTDLGERIKHAFEFVFQTHDAVIIIGSDCYELTTGHIDTAFNVLKEKQVVIGPANDGGYYLLGLRNNNEALFLDIEWSSSKVLDSTLRKVKAQGMSYELLPTLVDVDTLEDLNSSMLLKSYLDSLG